MANISFNPPSGKNERYAVGQNSVDIEITGGEDFTDNDYRNESDFQYRNFKQTYTFNYYTNSSKTKKVIEVSGRSGNDGEITTTLYGLKAGDENEIKVEITYSYETRSADILGTWSDWKEHESTKTNKGTLKVYTTNNKKSSDLWGNIVGLNETTNSSQATYIDGNFKQIADNWLAQLQIWRSWYDQQDKSDIKTWNGVSLVPSSPISAKWYNACASACTSKYNVQTGAYIEAKYFRDISEKVTTWS